MKTRRMRPALRSEFRPTVFSQRSHLARAILVTNEIAMNTAISFHFLRDGVAVAGCGNAARLSPGASCSSCWWGLIALLALIGYAYRAGPLYTFGSRLPMALNSAICFELFAVAALAVRPRRGLMMVITSDTTGGSMARRLLPAAILIPLILGALRSRARNTGFLKSNPAFHYLPLRTLSSLRR